MTIEECQDVSAVAFHPEDNVCVLANSSAGLTLVEIESGKKLKKNNLGDEKSFINVERGADGKYFIVRHGSVNSDYYLGNFADFSAKYVVKGGMGSFSPTGKELITGSFMRGYSLFDLESQQLLYNNFFDIQCCSQGNRLLLHDNDLTVRIIDTENNQELFVFPSIGYAFLSPCGNYLFKVSSNFGGVHLIDFVSCCYHSIRL